MVGLIAVVTSSMVVLLALTIEFSFIMPAWEPERFSTFEASGKSRSERMKKPSETLFLFRGWIFGRFFSKNPGKGGAYAVIFFFSSALEEVILIFTGREAGAGRQPGRRNPAGTEQRKKPRTPGPLIRQTRPARTPYRDKGAS
jgi:hypothetical protein